VTIGVGVIELVRLAEDRLGRPARQAALAAAAAGLLALATASGAAYLSRPTADRYEAYRFDLTAMANAAGPRDAVILDDYSATVIRFLDAGRTPAVIAPGTPLAHTRFPRLLALSQSDLSRALGDHVGSRVTVLAWRPDGSAAVYAAVP
jgi:hypothetical protein